MSQWKNRFSVLEEMNVMPVSVSSPLPAPRPVEIISTIPEKVYIRSTTIKYSTYIPVLMKTLDTGANLELSALLDCGATGLFLDSKFVQNNHLNTRKLPRAVPVYNVDGTLNQGGSIKEEVDVILTHKEES